MNVKRFLSQWARKAFLAITAAALIGGLVPAPRASAMTVSDGFNPNANNDIYAMAVQSDGKIVIGGTFTKISDVDHLYLARLNHDGTLDEDFVASGMEPVSADSFISAIAIQADGKILIGGDFHTVNGTPREHIARLNSDGSLDTGFDPGADDWVQAFAVQPDGKIVVGGYFTHIAGADRNYLVRLNSDGTTDAGFSGQTNNFVFALTLQADGLILVGGFFTTVNGVGRSHLARLKSNGSLDSTFTYGVSNSVWAIAVQADGRIVVGGSFAGIAGNGARNYICRLTASGTLDDTFIITDTNEMVRTIVIQPDGRILVGGEFTRIGGANRNYITRFNMDGTADSGFNPGADDLVWAIAVLDDRSIVAAGWFSQLAGETRNSIGKLYPDGRPDKDLVVDISEGGSITQVAVQPDGRIIIAGTFSTVNGVSRDNIARLYPDGALDTGFNPGVSGGTAGVLAIAIQPDGKILLGGEFSTLGGESRSNIGRLNGDGSLDAEFTPAVTGSVTAIALQPDDQMVIGGNFTEVNSTARSNLARLEADGSLDTGFNPGADLGVTSILIQVDGKILVGGGFTTLAGHSRNHVGRLETSGAIDHGFVTDEIVGGEVQAMLLQPDGRIVIGGAFGAVGAVIRNRLARLESDGALDADFNPGVDNTVWSLAQQRDGHIIAGGLFHTIGGGTRTHLARLDADGNLDTTWNPVLGGAATEDIVFGMAVQPDGKVLITGYFLTVDGKDRETIARLSADAPATQRLEVDSEAGTITWYGGGSGPEAGRVVFEESSDGVSFTPLGDAVRISGGWQLTGVTIESVGTYWFRVRGSASHGLMTGQSSLTESTWLLYLYPDYPFSVFLPLVRRN